MCISGVFMMKLHLLYNFVDVLDMFLDTSVLSVSVFAHFNVHIKRGYRELSRG